MKTRSKNILIIILTILLIISISIIIFTVMRNSNALEEIEGTVTVVSKDYLIIEKNDEDYLIDGIKNEYEIGDIAHFEYKAKNLDKNKNPKTIKIEKEQLVKKADKNNQIENNTSIEKDDGKTPFNPDNSNKTEQPQAPAKNNPDEEVLEYFQELENDFKSGSIKESLKSGFITVIDFLFYDGTIKGYTFKDLSDRAKLKVLAMALYFDNKIDNYFPDYKEEISSKTNKAYSTIKNEILEAYLNVGAKVCEYNGELCTKAKEEFSNIKKNFGLTWDLIKDIAKDGVNNLKKWYEIWSGK